MARSHAPSRTCCKREKLTQGVFPTDSRANLGHNSGHHLAPTADNLSNSNPEPTLERGVGIGYAPILWIGYGVGLMLAMVANDQGWTVAGVRGQPALLYLVPSTLLPCICVAYWRGELSELWSNIA